jgi:hypothetical protein
MSGELMQKIIEKLTSWVNSALPYFENPFCNRSLATASCDSLPREISRME